MKSLIGAILTSAALMTGAASASTVFATTGTIVTDGPRGTTNDRANINNALGSALGDFFELGFGAVVDFTFGTLFTGPANTVEVTFGSPSAQPESAILSVGLAGVFTTIGTLTNALSQGPAGQTLSFSGNFDTLRLTDTTARGNAASGGFDVDRISVSPVPLPAAGLLLLGGLGALGAMSRRRRKTA